MKKSLFALATVGAFAGAAQAQSSVTVYGVVDVGYVGGNARAAGTTDALTNKATFSQFQASGAESSNRLGFRGREDLGGGLAANFVIETTLNASNDTWNPSFRQAWAGLSSKGLGEARIGTQNSLIWQLAAPMTVGQLNNIAGSVINSTAVGVPTTVVSTASIAGGTSMDGNSNAAFTNRTQRTLQIASERISGIQAKAMYVMNDANSTQRSLSTAGQLGYSGGTNNVNGWGVSLDFTMAKFQIAGAYQAFNADNPYNATAAQIASGGVPTAYTTNTPIPCAGNGQQTTTFNSTTSNGFSSACQNVKDNQTFLAATYDFGILKAYVNYVNRKVMSQQDSNAYLKRSAQEIGARGYITKTVEGWASVGNGRYSSFGASNPTANITGYQAGANYWMSKRTNLYAIYGQAGTSSTTAGSANINNYAAGVRHTF